MYLYGFNKYAGVDKIWKTDGDFKAGDLLQVSDDFYISIGKNVSFFEQYVYSLKSDISKTKIIEKKLLNKQTLELLHWMVYHRYSTYKNTVKLFLPQEIDKLIDRKITKINQKSKKSISANNNLPSSIDILDFKLDLVCDGQVLVIFPDLRSLMNLTTQDFRDINGVDVLLSSNTQNQKDKSRRNIKLLNTKIILATHSEIFQNYKNLDKIFVVQAHKWYYSNQQDPRYKTIKVVEKLAEIWDSDLKLI